MSSYFNDEGLNLLRGAAARYDRAFDAHDAAMHELVDTVQRDFRLPYVAELSVAELEAQEPCAEEPVALCNGCGREACFVDRWCVDDGVFVEYQQCLRCGAKSAPGDPEAVYYA